VRALELVTPSGALLRCDADRHPEVFTAARVGLGALGVVTAVTLQTVPAFALRAVEGPGTLTEAIEGFEELMTSTDHVEFYWFPHTDATLLKCNTRVPLEEGLAPLPRWRAVWDDEILANGAFAGVVATGRRIPALVPPLARLSAKSVSARSWTDHAHRVFVSRRRVRFLEMEYAVPRAEAPAVLAELRRVHEAADWRAAFPVEVRLAAADDVPLSTASGRDTAYIAAHVPAGTDPGAWFAALEAIAGEVGGRPHWGKLHGLAAGALRSRYPRFDEFVALRDRLDPGGVLGNAYLDRVLGPVGGAHPA
jgi:L-gulonolactone oxidase